MCAPLSKLKVMTPSLKVMVKIVTQSLKVNMTGSRSSNVNVKVVARSLKILGENVTQSLKVKVKVVAESLKVSGPALLRHYTAPSFSVDELSDLRQFQLEHEDDHPLDLGSQAASTSVQTTTHVKPFNEIPGPRGLPLIGNMLSYSKLGKSVCSQWLLFLQNLESISGATFSLLLIFGIRFPPLVLTFPLILGF